MNDIVDSNLEKEKIIYEENRKKLGDRIFEIDSATAKNDENLNSRKNYIEHEIFENSFKEVEKEYLKNAFLTYSSDEVNVNNFYKFDFILIENFYNKFSIIEFTLLFVCNILIINSIDYEQQTILEFFKFGIYLYNNFW